MDADAPYDTTAFADVILLSSDNVHFYVLGPLLSLVSSFFREMFLMIRGPAVEGNETKDGHPIIPLEEDSGTIRLLLDVLYPSADEPPLTDVTLLWKVGKAAQKYFIDVVEGKLKTRILTSKLISEVPLSVYAVATDLGWETTALEAARRTLRISLEKLAFVNELHRIPGSGFYRFLEYRFRCQKSSRPEAEMLMKLPSGQNAPTIRASTDISSGILPEAPEPFNCSENADLILRSSDAVDFFVTEALIRVVSPIFNGMFPLQNPEAKGGRAILVVAEDSKVLHRLLNIVYHYIDEPDIQEYGLYKQLVITVRAYQMTSIERRLQKQATTSPLISKAPLHMYIVAMAAGWEDVAKMAALNTFLQPLRDISYIEEFNLITGADLYQLVQFRFKCGDAACKSLQEHTGFKHYGPSCWRNFWRKTVYCSADYWVPISSEGLDRDIRECPRGSTINGIYVSELDKIRARPGLEYNGNASSAGEIMKCWGQMENVIEEAVSKVPLGLL